MPVAEPQPIVIEKVHLSKLWNVILLNDDYHSYEYVIDLLMEIFHYDVAKAFDMTRYISENGQGIVDTTTRERAELKQEQVHSRGPDPMIPQSVGSITCDIEPAD